MEQPMNLDNTAEIILFVLLIALGVFFTYFTLCPQCKRLGWRKIIGEEDIPGSEYETRQHSSTEGYYDELRIKTRVFHECRNCGHVWEKKGSRTIKKL